MRRKSIIDIHIKAILGIIVYLIIASVFGFNNQFLHEAFGEAITDDADPGADVGGDGHNTAPSKDGSKDTPDTSTPNHPKVGHSGSDEVTECHQGQHYDKETEKCVSENLSPHLNHKLNPEDFAGYDS